MKHNELYDDAIGLLQALIRVPSFSREESGTADVIEQWLVGKGIEHVNRLGNNVWAGNLHFNPAKPTILLCSHHDTVRPSGAWTRDPFDPTIEVGSIGARGRSDGSDGSGTDGDAANGGDDAGGEARLYGLGSNDAGASVVSMAAAFRHFYDDKNLKYNLILALVGEEEISGTGGVRSILPELGLGANRGDFAIVGEPTMRASAESPANFAEPRGGGRAKRNQPTDMQLAIAEKGLMVLDCVAHGRAGHAARDEGDNAIYRAIKDIEWFRDYRFPRKSPLFGEVRMSVTIISAGTGHNVVPAECRFTVDCRVTEQYTNEEVLEVVRRHVASEVTPRSLHLRSSSISLEHPVVAAGTSLGMTTFGSPTTSDQVALTAIPSVKIGPGRSERSHTADEYVELGEIEQGIELYIKLLDRLLI